VLFKTVDTFSRSILKKRKEDENEDEDEPMVRDVDSSLYYKCQ
jgi:hypothetical protein